MRFFRQYAPSVLLLLTVGVNANAGVGAEESAPTYSDSVAPVLKNYCVKCHGPAKQEGKLNLALLTGIARGGESGPSVVAGKPDDSLLWQLVDSDEMPKDEALS